MRLINNRIATCEKQKFENPNSSFLRTRYLGIISLTSKIQMNTNSQDLSLLVQSQKEILEELDAENKQLRRMLTQQRNQFQLFASTLTQYGGDPQLSLQDQLHNVLTEKEQTIITLKQKAISAITQLSDHEKATVFQVQQKYEKEIKDLKQQLYKLQHEKEVKVRKYQQLCNTEDTESELLHDVQRYVDIHKMENKSLAQIGREKLIMREETVDETLKVQKAQLGLVFKDQVVQDLIDDKITEEEMAKYLIQNGDVY